ncbi:hypothetical protein LINPERHAP2_LOCUS32396, partial [Linum perenne]
MKKRRGIIPTAAAAAADQQEDQISNLPDENDMRQKIPAFVNLESFGAFLRILSLKKVRFPYSEDGSRVGDRILNNMIQAASSTLESLTLSDLDRIERLQVQDLPNLKTLEASELYCQDFEIKGVQFLDILH